MGVSVGLLVCRSVRPHFFLRAGKKLYCPCPTAATYAEYPALFSLILYLSNPYVCPYIHSRMSVRNAFFFSRGITRLYKVTVSVALSVAQSVCPPPLFFLVAAKRLYKRVCLSVGRSVHQHLVHKR